MVEVLDRGHGHGDGGDIGNGELSEAGVVDGVNGVCVHCHEAVHCVHLAWLLEDGGQEAGIVTLHAAQAH